MNIKFLSLTASCLRHFYCHCDIAIGGDIDYCDLPILLLVIILKYCPTLHHSWCLCIVFAEYWKTATWCNTESVNNYDRSIDCANPQIAHSIARAIIHRMVHILGTPRLSCAIYRWHKFTVFVVQFLDGKF